ncbi:MAG: phage tail terminator protein [Panacagrimonas sp.]
MIDLNMAPYIARLSSEVPGFTEVGGAAEMDAAMTGHVVPPAAYLVYVGGDAGPTQVLGYSVHQQSVTARFEVFVCERNVADVFGAGASLDLLSWRTRTLKALVGFTPDMHELSPLNRTTDRLWRMQDGEIWWRLGFSTSFLMRVDTAYPEETLNAC